MSLPRLELPIATAREPAPAGKSSREQLEEALHEVIARNDQVRAAPTEQHLRELQRAVTEWFVCF